MTLDALVQARSAEFLEQNKRRGPRRPSPYAPRTAPPEIEREFQQALGLFRGLLKDAPQNADYLRALARCHRGILPVAWADDDEQTVAAAKQQAISILQQLADRHPDDLAIRFELADTLALAAPSDARTPLPEPEVAALQQSLRLAQGLHESCPTAAEYTLLLANVHQRLGTHYTSARAWSDAREHLTAAAATIETLVKSSPTNALFHISLARVRWDLADSLQRQGSYQPARELLEKAIGQYAAFRDTEPGRRAKSSLPPRPPAPPTVSATRRGEPRWPLPSASRIGGPVRISHKKHKIAEGRVYKERRSGPWGWSVLRNNVALP